MNENRPVQEEDLQAYIDNALDEARRHEIEAYLHNHPEVARRVDGYIAQRQQLRAAFGPVASEPIPPELNLRHMLARAARAQPPPWRLAASVFVALCVGGLAGGSARRHRAGIGRHCRAGPRGHGQLPGLRIRSEPACGDRRERQRDLVKWVSTRLQRPVAVPDLTGSGYRYMGGRLVATEHGPAGLFLYDDGHGTRLAMLVRPMQVEQDMPMKPHRQAGVAGYSWADQGLGYSLVGSASTGGLHPLADEMRRQIDQQVRKPTPA